MPMRKLDSSQWKEYFDALSNRLAGWSAELQVTTPDGDEKLETDLLPIQGMTFDPDRARLDLFIETTNHAVNHPERIFVDDEGGFATTIRIEDGEGNAHIVELRREVSDLRMVGGRRGRFR